MKPFYYFFFSIFLIGVTSCDPGTLYREGVVNDSNYDLIFYIYNDSTEGKKPFYLADSFVINSKTNVVIGERNGIGKVEHYSECDAITFVDSVRIVPVDTHFSAIIDPQNTMNWTFNVIKKTRIGGGECSCFLVIENSDIH